MSQSPRFAFGQQHRVKDSRGYYQIPEQAAGDPLFHFTRATFEPYLQSEFQVTVGPYKVVGLTLVKVEDRRRPARKGEARLEGECFSLLFKANMELSDLQQTYVLQHAALGKFTLFLVDASDKGKGIYYQAIINHMRPIDNPAMKTS
ncbi:MAG TPA: hypothetical protein VIQ24_14670 [Pyrinomonadaceae bacterium]